MVLMPRNICTDPSFEIGSWIPGYVSPGFAQASYATNEAYKGIKVGRVYTTSSGGSASLTLTNICQIGQEYKVSFRIKTKDKANSASITWSGPFSITSEQSTDRWIKYSYTGIATSTSIAFSLNVGLGAKDVLIDDVRVEPTPIKVAVVHNTLADINSGGTTDFTQAGFGTPKAAFGISVNATPSGNPNTDRASMCFGLWDGTDQIAIGFGKLIDGTDRTNYAEGWNDSTAFLKHYSLTVPTGIVPSEDHVSYTISNITDGVRLTLGSGDAQNRYCSIIMFAGHDVESQIYDSGGIDSSDYHFRHYITDFKPDLLFGLSHMQTNDTHDFEYRNGFGIATFKPTITQYSNNPYDTGYALSISNRGARHYFTDQFMYFYPYIDILSAGSGSILTTSRGLSTIAFAKMLAIKAPGVNFDLRLVPQAGSGAITDIDCGFRPVALLGMQDYYNIINASLLHSWHYISIADATSQANYEFVNSYITRGGPNVDCSYEDTTFIGTENGIGIATINDNGYSIEWHNSILSSGDYNIILAIQGPTDTNKIIGTASGKMYLKR